MSDTKIFTVNKFLGINESADGTTELKLGEAAVCENFYITDSYNLKTRPGIRHFNPEKGAWNDWVTSSCQNIWSGHVSGRAYILWWTSDILRGWTPERGGYDSINLYNGARIQNVLQIGDDIFLLAVDKSTGEIFTPKIFVNYDIASAGALDYDIRVGGGYSYNPYIPLAVSECTPAGGGETMEPLNILTNKFRVQFTSKDSSADYVLPSMTASIVGVHIAGYEYTAAQIGRYDATKHTFTFNGHAPADGVEVVFVCVTDDADLAAAKDRFLAMPYHEYFNGSTDTRVFFYGDGTNVCYYTGEPAFPDRHGYGDQGDFVSSGAGRDGTHTLPSFYIPAGNEIAVDFSDSAITSMVRHYSRLLVFKPDGAAAITYEPVTLADGSVVAGFYLRPVHREFGNDAPGQVVLVNNCPRTFTHGSIYEWRVSTGYTDERYAKCISQKVAKTIAAADPAKIVVCDDGVHKTYYVFLNDEAGTVLVNRYDLDAWTIYKSTLATNVSQCLSIGDQVVFLRSSANAGGVMYCFDHDSTYDDNVETDGKSVPIEAVWESGFMSFGADYRRKYSSHIWLSLLPELGAELEVTAQSDKRSDYITKTAGYNLLSFANIDFSNFSFLTNYAPKVKRIQLKIKKFVYYKLILRVKKPGARATVLGYDQQIRYSSNVK